jgi:nitrous oxidase accessory protein
MFILALAVATVQSPTPFLVSAAGPYRTVTAAIAAAPAGATVRVTAGRYLEPTIIIDHRLNVVGDSGAVLDGGGDHAIIIVRGYGVTIRGLEFVNTGISYREDRAAVRVADAGQCTIDHNRFTGTFFAIYLARATNCDVSGNVIVGTPGREAATGNGIHLWASRDIRVTGNRISGHRDGIYLEFTRHADVRDNTSELNGRYGMHFMYTDSSVYVGNTFRSNGGGVAVMYSKVVTMERNLFTSNHGPTSYGLLLKEIQDARLVGNTFRHNTVGLLADGADRMVARRNTFEDNGWGIRMLASTVDGRVEGNTFTGNSFDVAVNGVGTSTLFTGNWWDNYRGWDLDHDGIGDVPYHPVRLFALLVEHAQPALLLQRSLFVKVLDAAERALPVLTPAAVADARPLMKKPTQEMR